MFKIGELSKLSNVSIRMLRHYDETGLLKPAMLEEQSGYRLYTSEQVSQLHRILFLRDLGFQVREMAGLLFNWSDAALQEELLRRKQVIAQHIADEQEKLQRLERMLEDIRSGISDQGGKSRSKIDFRRFGGFSAPGAAESFRRA